MFPIAVTENKARTHHVNLLIINGKDAYHYILIRNLSRLLSPQYECYNRKLYFLPFYSHGCSSQLILDTHQEKCKA